MTSLLALTGNWHNATRNNFLLFSVSVDDGDGDDDAILTNSGRLLKKLEDGLANVENAAAALVVVVQEV